MTTYRPVEINGYSVTVTFPELPPQHRTHVRRVESSSLLKAATKVVKEVFSPPSSVSSRRPHKMIIEVENVTWDSEV